MSAPNSTVFVNGDSRYLALGEMPSMPVYEIVEGDSGSRSLRATRMTCPACLRFMPYADEELDLGRRSWDDLKARLGIEGDIPDPLPPPKDLRSS